MGAVCVLRENIPTFTSKAGWLSRKLIFLQIYPVRDLRNFQIECVIVDNFYCMTINYPEPICLIKQNIKRLPEYKYF